MRGVGDKLSKLSAGTVVEEGKLRFGRLDYVLLGFLGPRFSRFQSDERSSRKVGGSTDSVREEVLKRIGLCKRSRTCIAVF